MSGNYIDQFINLLKRNFQAYLGISIAIFLFILFFQPFPIEKFEFENNLLFVAGFGIIVFTILVLLQIAFHKLLSLPEADRAGHSMLYSVYYISIFVSTSLAFAFYIRFVGQTAITFNIAMRTLVICLGVPVLINLRNNRLAFHERHKRLIQEFRLMQDRNKQFTESYSNKYIELLSEKESDNIRVLVSEIIFVKSADNYVEVAFKNGEEVKKRMIRNTLKNMEQQLREFNNFLRTHRTSIVNIQYVDKLNKNFNSYWLSLTETNETIPVSRQYLMMVKDLL